jgi:hypothetical protein
VGHRGSPLALDAGHHRGHSPARRASGCRAALRHADQTAILIHQQAPSEGSACQHFKWRLPEMGLNAVHYKFAILNVRSRPDWPEF